MKNIVKTPIKVFHTIEWNGKRVGLTRRQYLGWKFENRIEGKLIKHKFVYERHDLGTHKKCDFLVFGMGSLRLETPIYLEAKYSKAKIFPSWVKRDYLQRFPKKARDKLVVTNTQLRITQQGIDLLNVHGIKRIYEFQLVSYLEDLVLKRWREERGLKDTFMDTWLGGNKLLEVLRYNNYSISYLMSFYLASNTLHKHTKHKYTLHIKGRWRRGERSPWSSLVYHPFLKKPRALSKHHLRFCNSISIYLLTLKGHLQIINSRIHPFITSGFSHSKPFEDESFSPPSPSAYPLTLANSPFQQMQKPDLTLDGKKLHSLQCLLIMLFLHTLNNLKDTN